MYRHVVLEVEQGIMIISRGTLEGAWKGENTPPKVTGL
jgi:hypothetical protein